MNNHQRRGPGPQMRRGGGPGMFGAVREKPKHTKETLGKLISYVSKNKKLFIMTMIVVLVNTVLTLYCNVLVKDVIKSFGEMDENFNFVKNPDQSLFAKSLLILGIVYVVNSFLQYFSSILGAHLSVRTVRVLRNDLFARIVYLPINYVDTHPHGDIISRMSNDVDNVSNAIGSTLSTLISSLLTIVGCLFIMIYYSPLLTLVSLSVLVLTMTFTKIMNKYVRPLFRRQQEILGLLNTQTEEMVTGHKTVATYNKEKDAIISSRQNIPTYV